MAKKTNAPSIVAGIDLGNGYVKSVINGGLSVCPSIAVTPFSIKQEKLGESDIPDFINNIINKMDVSFTTPLVKDTSRRYLGERAIQSGQPLQEFDIDIDHTGKADVDLSGVLILSVLAANVLGSYYEVNKKLPEDRLTMNVKLATALPIAEFSRNHVSYRQRLLNSGRPHTVTIHNFEQAISIDLIIESAYISNEGEAAQYGLMFANDKFLEYVAKAAQKHDKTGVLAGLSGKDLVSLGHTLGIDIGEGTIDFAVFNDGRFNSDVSTNVGQGFGHILDAALNRLRDELHLSYDSRKKLSEFIYTQPTVLTKNKWDKVWGVVKEEAHRFANTVAIQQTSKVYGRIGASNEIIFVYGGGASVLEDSLYPLLDQMIYGDSNDSGIIVPIVYLDSAYSRYLNVQGLYELASRL